MAQSMRPVSTVTDQGNYTGATAHGSVDGTAPDTGDYWNGNDNQNDVLEVLLTDLSATPPATGTCTVSIYETVSDTNSAPAAGGGSVTYDLEVYEATTQRASRTGITPTDSTFTLDNALTFTASSITDWSDVRVRFTSYGTGGSPSGRRGAAISYIDISTPDAAAGTDDLLADDVESASEVTSPVIQQTHELVSTNVESASNLSSPALGQEHTLLADDVESASEVTTPAASESNILLADDVESASELTSPAIAQVQVLLTDNVESASELTSPALGQLHVLLSTNLESSSELSSPNLSEAGGGGPGLARKQHMGNFVSDFIG